VYVFRKRLPFLIYVTFFRSGIHAFLAKMAMLSGKSLLPSFGFGSMPEKTVLVLFNSHFIL